MYCCSGVLIRGRFIFPKQFPKKIVQNAHEQSGKLKPFCITSRHPDQNTFNNASRPNSARIGTRVCFRTAPPDSAFNKALGDYGSDNWGNTSHAGGCLAFGGTDDQVLACLCGARNSSSRWRQTNGDGYSWIISNTTWRNANC